MDKLPPEIIKRKLEKRSHMAEKFAMIPKGWKPPDHPIPPDAEQIGMPGYFKKRYIFIHGALMDTVVLAKVLDLSPDDEKLKLRPAQVVGYHTRLWRSYPVLREGPRYDCYVDGLAYYAQSQDEVDRLSSYEKDNYMRRKCLIKFLDIEDAEKQKVIGDTFVWNGDPAELTEEKLRSIHQFVE